MVDLFKRSTGSIRSRSIFLKIDGIDSFTVDLFKRSTRAIRSRSIFFKDWKNRKIEFPTLHPSFFRSPGRYQLEAAEVLRLPPYSGGHHPRGYPGSLHHDLHRDLQHDLHRDLHHDLHSGLQHDLQPDLTAYDEVLCVQRESSDLQRYGFYCFDWH